MYPILAEPVSHRGRFAALVVALTVVASLAALVARPMPHHSRHGHHHLRAGKCTYAGYVYVVR